MKIKPEHYAVMRDTIAPLAPKIKAHREALIKSGASSDPDLRARWDALWAADLGPFIARDVTTYAKDAHIDTALRQIMREIGVTAKGVQP